MPKQTPLKDILRAYPNREWGLETEQAIPSPWLKWLIDRAEKAQKAPEYPQLDWHEGPFQTEDGVTWAGRAIMLAHGNKTYWAPLPKQIHLRSAVGAFRKVFAGAGTLDATLYKGGKPTHTRTFPQCD